MVWGWYRITADYSLPSGLHRSSSVDSDAATVQQRPETERISNPKNVLRDLAFEKHGFFAKSSSNVSDHMRQPRESLNCRHPLWVAPREDSVSNTSHRASVCADLYLITGVLTPQHLHTSSPCSWKRPHGSCAALAVGRGGTLSVATTARMSSAVPIPGFWAVVC